MLQGYYDSVEIDTHLFLDLCYCLHYMNPLMWWLFMKGKLNKRPL